MMQSYDINAIPPLLLANIAHAARERFGLPCEPTATRAWFMVKPYSRILRIELQRGSWTVRVFAKLPSPKVKVPARSASRYEREYEILNSLHEARTECDAAASVEPLLYDSETPALVTLEASGHELAAAYSRTARLIPVFASRSDTVRRVELCGLWLRQFHDRTSLRAAPFDVEELIEYCGSRIEMLRQAHEKYPIVDRLERSISIAATLSGPNAMTDIPWSLRHNDFSSHNVIATPRGGVRVLDFTMVDSGPSVFDTCSFWFELEMLKYNPSFSIAFLSKLQHTFLTAYGLTSTNDIAFRLARLRYSVVRVCRMLSMGDRKIQCSPSTKIGLRQISQWLDSWS